MSWFISIIDCTSVYFGKIPSNIHSFYYNTQCTGVCNLPELTINEEGKLAAVVGDVDSRLISGQQHSVRSRLRATVAIGIITAIIYKAADTAGEISQANGRGRGERHVITNGEPLCITFHKFQYTSHISKCELVF